MHKVMYMKEPAPEAPHLRIFWVRSCPVAWKTTNNWLWIAWMFVAYRFQMAYGSLPSAKKNKSLWKSANQNNQMLNFDSELFPQTLFFMVRFSIVSIHLRRDQGELRGTSVVHAMSSAGHKQRSQGGATPGSGRPSVKSTTTKPIWEVTTRGTRVSGQKKNGQRDFI